MDSERWYDRCRDWVSDADAGATKTKELWRRRLIDLHQLSLAAPARIQEAYKALGEAAIDGEKDRRIDEVARGGLDWTRDVVGDAAWALALGAEMRAYDSELWAVLPTHQGVVVDTNDCTARSARPTWSRGGDPGVRRAALAATRASTDEACRSTTCFRRTSAATRSCSSCWEMSRPEATGRSP